MAFPTIVWLGKACDSNRESLAIRVISPQILRSWFEMHGLVGGIPPTLRKRSGPKTALPAPHFRVVGSASPPAVGGSRADGRRECVGVSFRLPLLPCKHGSAAMERRGAAAVRAAREAAAISSRFQPFDDRHDSPPTGPRPLQRRCLRPISGPAAPAPPASRRLPPHAPKPAHIVGGRLPSTAASRRPAAAAAARPGAGGRVSRTRPCRRRRRSSAWPTRCRAGPSGPPRRRWATPASGPPARGPPRVPGGLLDACCTACCRTARAGGDGQRPGH